MNYILNCRWHESDPIACIHYHFCSEKFTRLYRYPVTCFPTNDLIDELRIHKLATLEVIENRSAATVYRIRQTGVVYLCRIGKKQSQVFASRKDYLHSPDSSLLLYNFYCKPLAFIIKKNGNQTYIHHLKHPQFAGIVETTDVSHTDQEQTDQHCLYEIKQITWHDHPPTTEKENTNLIKKATRFVRNNYLPVPETFQPCK